MSTPNFNKAAMRSSAVTIDPDDVLTMGPFDSLSVGLSWDASANEQSGLAGKAAKRLGCDLDAGVTILQGGEPVLMAWMDNLDPVKDRSVIHTGDNTTGAGEGDDETLEIATFGAIPAEFDSLIFFAANYKKDSFARRMANKGKESVGFHGADNVKMTLYTASGDDHQAFSIRPSLLTDDNVCLIARADRATKGDQNSDWEIRRISKMTTVPKGDKRALLRAAMAA